jgi:hypothetical protein
MVFTMVESRFQILNKKLFQEMSIYRATKNFITFQILQPISIIWKHFRNFEGADPKGLEFVILSLVLFGHIPFEYQFSQLEILLIAFCVKVLPNFMLSVMCFF